jgi:excisionase family DNA binding protein
MLGMLTSCIYKKVEKGKMQALKIGTAIRFSEENIRKFLDQCQLKKTTQKNIQSSVSDDPTNTLKGRR